MTRITRQRALVHRMRGEDPGDPATAAADFVEILERSAALLQRVAEQEGHQAVQIPAAPATPLLARLLKEAGMRFVERVHVIESHAIGRDVETLKIGSIVIAMKLSRLAGDLEMDGPPEADSALNRLLLERLDDDVRGALERLSTMLPAELVGPCETARAAIAKLLERAFEPVPAEIRAYLQARVAEGTAPSPFCTRAVL